jgi:glycosyltransferase involved in cell wall biosynthesis
MNTSDVKKRLLIYIVAYNAEKSIESTLKRIPHALLENYEVEVLVIDDASKDETFERGEAVRLSGEFPLKLTVLYNPVNQGYGGNQKIGFHYAIREKFDLVALVHGDGQYAPECLPDLVRPIVDGKADVVFGSRMLLKKGALSGGMPIYKYFGNKILTWLQNRLLRANLSEFHSGYRIYSVEALRKIPFHLNSNVFHFDTEIIIQLLFAQQRIEELPIPTYYGDEICHVNGMKYAKDVLVASLKARAQELSLFYDRKFDCRPSAETNAHYVPKLEYASSHSAALEHVQGTPRVLDVGCAGGYLGAELRRRGCRVTGVDLFPLSAGVELDAFHLHDLNAGPLPVKLEDYDLMVMLDVIEHLLVPENFVDQLRESAAYAPNLKLVITTGNVAFIVTRLMLLLGQLNYGKRGILDMTHTRLFTFGTLRRLFEQAGFDVLEERGIPAPFPLALGNRHLGRLLLKVNQGLIAISRSLFSYQMLMVVRPRPSLPLLLQNAWTSSKTRSELFLNQRGSTAAVEDRLAATG